LGETNLEWLNEPGRAVFYPKVGHCVFRGLTQDLAVPDQRLIELEDMEEGSRILVPMDRVADLRLRRAGSSLEEIQEVLSAEFEPPLEDPEERQRFIEELVREGSPRGLARALKHLHLQRQVGGLTREEEQIRRKIRSWLAAEVALARGCTRAEAQALLTRTLQDAMAAHRQKEKEEAAERRRAAKAEKQAAAQGRSETSDQEPEQTA
jgi:RNA polymerase-interacting CarD/CdnL/TRCF family regulator